MFYISLFIDRNFDSVDRCSPCASYYCLSIVNCSFIHKIRLRVYHYRVPFFRTPKQQTCVLGLQIEAFGRQQDIPSLYAFLNTLELQQRSTDGLYSSLPQSVRWFAFLTILFSIVQTKFTESKDSPPSEVEQHLSSQVFFLRIIFSSIKRVFSQQTCVGRFNTFPAQHVSSF